MLGIEPLLSKISLAIVLAGVTVKLLGLVAVVSGCKLRVSGAGVVLFVTLLDAGVIDTLVPELLPIDSGIVPTTPGSKELSVPSLIKSSLGSSSSPVKESVFEGVLKAAGSGPPGVMETKRELSIALN